MSSPAPSPRTRRAVVAVAAVAGTLLPATPVLAHPGGAAHGIGDGLAHPLTGPDHLLAMVAVGVVAALAGRRWLAWTTPAAFLVGMLGGAALGLSGVQWSLTETAIGLSVVALGLAVAVGRPTDARWWSAALPLVALAFGAAHGAAHGAEAGSAAPLAFLAGMVAATAALHAGGAVLGSVLRRAPVARMAGGALLAGAGAALLTGA